jgi:hypothetical protein
MNSPFCLLLLFRGIKGDDGTGNIWKDLRVCKDGISVQEKYHCRAKTRKWKDDLLRAAGMRIHKRRQKKRKQLQIAPKRWVPNTPMWYQTTKNHPPSSIHDHLAHPVLIRK